MVSRNSHFQHMSSWVFIFFFIFFFYCLKTIFAFSKLKVILVSNTNMGPCLCMHGEKSSIYNVFIVAGCSCINMINNDIK